ncbi:MAG TPA: hypothetical protein VN953_01815 [Gemmatimonadales bacterium]|nr:hypothetical protein [Gemmatimonadales bacterium]
MIGLCVAVAFAKIRQVLLTRDSAVIDKRRAQHLLGETMRDIGILVVVFAPLDAFFRHERTALLPLGLAVAGALILIVLGIMVEATE